MSDPAKAKRVMAALLTMKKLDIRQLQQAADQQ
jgi:predicted 3-demethylubiquinone-9 3-methyltransferase (glyoxalase superfamily)